GLDTYAPARLTDARRLALAERVTHVIDPDSPFPRGFPGWVRVRLTDGRLLEARAPDGRGSVSRPLPGAEIVEKLRDDAGRAPAAPTERVTRVVPPPLHYETTKPPDSDFYPDGGVKVEHDPAFIEPFAGRYETTNGSGRFGLSGWTAPNPPVGSPVSGWRDVSGWFALGFSVTWDGPPAPRARPR